MSIHFQRNNSRKQRVDHHYRNGRIEREAITLWSKMRAPTHQSQRKIFQTCILQYLHCTACISHSLFWSDLKWLYHIFVRVRANEKMFYLSLFHPTISTLTKITTQGGRGRNVMWYVQEVCKCKYAVCGENLCMANSFDTHVFLLFVNEKSSVVSLHWNSVCLALLWPEDRNICEWECCELWNEFLFPPILHS